MGILVDSPRHVLTSSHDFDFRHTGASLGIVGFVNAIGLRECLSRRGNVRPLGDVPG